MRNVSSEWIEKVNSGEDVAYLKYIDFELVDGTKLSVDNSDLWSNGFKFNDTVTQSDSFDIGTAIVNSATVTLNNFDDKFTDYVFEGARVVCYIGLQLADETTEKIRICTMTVTDAPYQNSVLIDLTLEDDMRKFDSDYSASKLSYPATRLQIVQDICNICDVTLQSTSFYRDNYVVQTRPSEDSLTCRQVLSWVAMLGCQWARCDEYGRLVLDWYNTEPSDGDYVEIDTTSGLTVNLEDVVITGVRVTEYADTTGEDDTQPGTYLEGNEGYVIEISDNKLIGIGDGQTIASIIGARVIGMKFRPLSANILTDVRLEAGDPIKVTSSKGVTYTTYITSLTLQPGAYESIANNAKSATRNSATQYSQMTQIAVEARKSILAEKTNREKAIEALGTRIDESSGVYTTEEKQPDGSYVYYLHNKKTLAESDIVWKMTAEAWGVSTDGGKTYNAGMTVDGDTIVRILTAEGVNADWIKTGALEITDDDGNTIFKADMDNKTVTISGDFVTIGGKTATEAINDANDTAEEALNVASLAKNMTMQLSNGYQSIPVDKDGKYTTFPTCETTPQVMYGTSDITKSCTYTYTTSDGVTGKYNSTTHTYTVTALSTDIGWVDIKATYINNISVTKRFNLAKLYAGQDGAAGADAVTYQLESNMSVIKTDKWGDLYNSEPLSFSAYKVDSNGREAYPGRFLLQISNDGVTWETVYTSLSDETSISLDDLSLALGADESTTVLSADGSDTAVFGTKISLDFSTVRCELYASGGLESLIDQTTVQKVVDAESLTQEEIFNLLTNNGEAEGIYLLPDEQGVNQLYISFSYARGGSLVLGGKDDKYGNIEVLDSQGNSIGYWGLGGITLKRNGWNYFNGNVWCEDLVTTWEGGEESFRTFEIRDGMAKGMADTTGGKYDTGVLSLCTNMSDYDYVSGDVVLKAEEHDLYLEAPNGTIYASHSLDTKKLTVNNAATLKSTLSVDGVTTLTGNLTANGTGTFNNVTTFNVAPRMYNFSTYSSGGHIGFASDGYTLCNVSSSSKRYKDIGEDITESDIEEWYKIQPVWAKYKDGYLADDDENVGKYLPMFIAEDVEEHLPQVAVHRDDQVEDWNERVMIPAMFQMIKSQKELIDKLTARVDELERKVK